MQYILIVILVSSSLSDMRGGNGSGVALQEFNSYNACRNAAEKIFEMADDLEYTVPKSFLKASCVPKGEVK